MKTANWRNPREYEYPPSSWLSEKEFYAWQFLRRNKEYHKEYDRERGLYLKRHSDKTPEKLAFEMSFGIVPEDEQSAAKWGLWAYGDPDQNSPYCIFNRHYGSMILGKQIRFAIGHPVEDESLVPDKKIAMTFEIKLPIPPQIELAKKMLTKFQKDLEDEFKLTIIKNIKSQVPKWKNYLGIYDASSNGVKPFKK